MARNKIVAAVASQQNIPLDDLYHLVEKHPEYWSDDGVHFKPEGQSVEADQVVKIIVANLPAK
jgi:lysophospholipase L1-like esterase